MPCAFFLTNYSVNGTVVNGHLLHSRGEQISLHNGDIVSLGRASSTDQGSLPAVFVEFRFDLEGSCLYDADAPVDVQRRVAPTSFPQQELRVTDAALQTTRSSTTGGMNPCIQFGDADLEPLIVLEIGGSAVREGILPEHRRIVHGPPQGGAEPCPPLIIGRAMQPSFWVRLLVQEAFDAMSRQHMRIEVCEEAGSGGPASFCVRNLSDRNPIRIATGVDESSLDAARPLDRDDRRPLCHGDVLVVNPNKGNMLYVTFLDLAKLHAPKALEHESDDVVCSAGPLSPPAALKGEGYPVEECESAWSAGNYDLHQAASLDTMALAGHV